MRGSGGLWGGMSAPFSGEQAEALAHLDEYQALLQMVILGVALQYRSLDLERCRLLETEDANAGQESCRPQDFQAAALLITLCALFGFQRQATQLAAQTAQAGGVADTTDVSLGAASIGITLTRLVRLLCTQQKAEGELETVEEFGAPLD